MNIFIITLAALVLCAAISMPMFIVFRPQGHPLSLTVIAPAFLLLVILMHELIRAIAITNQNDGEPLDKSNQICMNITIVVFAVILSLGAIEIVLSIHNPFFLNLRGNKITLPIYQKSVRVNPYATKLDKRVIVSRNSLGF